MTNNGFGVTSVAARPQVPYEEPKDPPEAGLDRRQSSRAIDILTIGDNPTLSVYLTRLFQNSRWAMARARTREEGLSFLRNNRAAVAVCEESLPDGFWQNAAAGFRSLPDAPALVVVSDDQSLVHEVLALGGFDVLVRPLSWMKRFEGSAAGAP